MPAADALRPVAEDERRERFSFALASALGLSAQAQQNLLYSQASCRGLYQAQWLLLLGRRHQLLCLSLHGRGRPLWQTHMASLLSLFCPGI